ncbi:zinc-ribbon domain containing protein [Marinobacterium sp. YM272]|uniref:zinc-ribbon domain containing protein n=1 Tax=Marinobacterium sp. YM272 TaxID=3421654 RepID=UPI003D8000B0
MSRKTRSKHKRADRLPVDPSRLNMGNTYSSAPEYYYDIEFDCQDCGVHQTWTAQQQKWWYEEVGGYFFAGAVRCRDCRAKERERKRIARLNAGHEVGE